MKLRISSGVCLVVICLIATGCAATSESAVTHSAAPSAALTCEPFAATPPPNPEPAPTPQGDPSQPSSFAALQDAVTAAAQDPRYAKQAVLCAEGQNDATVCNKDYWPFDGAGLPVASVDCNFFYMRAADDYWTGLTPLVLAEYGDYLKVGADGKDPSNAAAGPHTTVSEIGGNVVTLPAINVTPKGGVLDPANIESVIAPVLTSTSGTSSAGKNTILPVLSATALAPDCSPVYYRTGSSGPWGQVDITAVPTKAGTKFWCVGETGNEGTAYVAITLGAVNTDGTITATPSVVEGGTKTSALRHDPNGPFNTENIVWPTGIDEVKNATPIDFTIGTGKSCVDPDSHQPVSCLHLWIASPKKDAQGNYTACKLWITLEMNPPGLFNVMHKYGLSTAGYTPHISLAKSPNLQGSDATTYCGRAARLNSGVGVTSSGSPPLMLAMRYQ